MVRTVERTDSGGESSPEEDEEAAKSNMVEHREDICKFVSLSAELTAAIRDCSSAMESCHFVVATSSDEEVILIPVASCISSKPQALFASVPSPYMCMHKDDDML